MLLLLLLACRRLADLGHPLLLNMLPLLLLLRCRGEAAAAARGARLADSCPGAMRADVIWPC